MVPKKDTIPQIDAIRNIPITIGNIDFLYSAFSVVLAKINFNPNIIKATTETIIPINPSV